VSEVGSVLMMVRRHEDGEMSVEIISDSLDESMSGHELLTFVTYSALETLAAAGGWSPPGQNRAARRRR